MRDKRERFVKLAEARTDKAIKAIRLVGNLSHRSNYDFDDDDVEQILRALDKEIRALKIRFGESCGAKANTFRLKNSVDSK